MSVEKPPRLSRWGRGEYRGLVAEPGMPPITHPDIEVERGIRVPMPDGASLDTDHWRPRGASSGATVLIRTPYGLLGPGSFARFFAEHGHHVIVQACRGTFGSGGDVFEPFARERVDGRAALDWVRAQPWAQGPVHSFGFSYYGLTQWAMCDEPGGPDAMTIGVSARDFGSAVLFDGGGISLETMLFWSYAIDAQERSIPAQLLRLALAGPRIRRASMTLPVAEAARVAVGHEYPPFREWMAHPDAGDPYWRVMSFAQDPANVPPTTLVAGWQDLFLVGGFRDLAELTAAGRDVRMIAGDWNHGSLEPGRVAMRDALLRLAGADADLPRVLVELSVGGGARDLAAWPPPAAEPRSWTLAPEGALLDRVARNGQLEKEEEEVVVRYRYDPADPTPNAGGRGLNPFTIGRRDQRPRERRDDVPLFTTEPLETEAVVIGHPVARLRIASTNPGFDLFLRLCDVDEKGVSHSVVDVFRRAPAADADDVVRLDFPAMAHRFARGHRIRLQVSSGAHPLHLRNGGTGAMLPEAGELRASDQTLTVGAGGGSTLELPLEA